MDQTSAQDTRRKQSTKSASAFRTISEVSTELDVPQHVLRFWETKFNQIKPLKRGGGRRYYRPEDLALLRRIRDLLYTDGYTIRGVQRLLRQSGIKAFLESESKPEDDDDAAEAPEAAPAPGAAQTAEAAIAVSAATAGAPASGGLTAETQEELKSILGDLTALRGLLPNHKR